jgi:hypothetical protein
VQLNIRLLNQETAAPTSGNSGAPGTAAVRLRRVSVTGNTELQSDDFSCDSVRH